MPEPLLYDAAAAFRANFNIIERQTKGRAAEIAYHAVAAALPGRERECFLQPASLNEDFFLGWELLFFFFLLPLRKDFIEVEAESCLRCV